MWWFSKKEGVVHQRKLDKLVFGYHYLIDQVKNTTGWIHYFSQKHKEHDERLEMLELHLNNNPNNSHFIDSLSNKHKDQERRIERIETHLTYMPKLSHEDVEKIVIKNKPDYERLIERIKDINLRLAQLEQKNYEPKANLKAKIIQKVSKNSKDYIKDIIRSLIEKYRRISALQIKEIVVDEQKICSKSSFYRILAEVENESHIGCSHVGKEKFYSIKEIKHN